MGGKKGRLKVGGGGRRDLYSSLGFVTGPRFRVIEELESCGFQAWELPYAALRNRKLGKTCLILHRPKTDLLSFFCLCAKVP